MTRRLLLPTAFALAAVAVLLAGCSGSSSSNAGKEPGTGSTTGSGTPSGSSSTTGRAGSPSGSPSGSPTAVVQGVRLTADGSALRVGDTAHVSWRPNQKTTGVIAVKVTGLDQVPMSTFRDWRLTGPVLRSTPYFVHARVQNLGHRSLAGLPVPLYLLDKRNVLLQASTFRARFDACPSTPFPSRFTHGKSARVCLVYFAPDHGALAAVSFRPSQDVDGITWRGPVTVVKAKKAKG